MRFELPPLLTVSATNGDLEQFAADVSIVTSTQTVRRLMESFAVELLRVRKQRGLTQPRLILSDYKNGLPGEEGSLAFPHIYQATDSFRPTLIWEEAPHEFAEQVLEADASAIELWAGQPEVILRLANEAGQGLGSDTVGHLSFRWVLKNQVIAASRVARSALDHVSIHCSPNTASVLGALLVQGLGLVEVARPASITTPGRWFVSSNAMVHVSTRKVASPTAVGTGSAPNHICLSVDDLVAVLDYLERASLEYKISGSLTNVRQLWVRLGDNVTIEVQAP